MLSPLATYARLALLYFVNIPGNPAIDWLTSRRGCISSLEPDPHCAPKSSHYSDRSRPDLLDHAGVAHCREIVRADKSFAEQVLKRAQALIAVSENSQAGRRAHSWH